MRIGSLFAGIGGLELGLESAIPGAHVVWQVEQAEWPRRVLARHWPDADRSVTDVRDAPGHLHEVDIICGGFPCQDISPAGKGAGITGEKSGLWSEYARIVRNLRPRFIVVENSGLLPVRGLDVVLGDLAALGYDAEWSRIGACDVGAPHRRWRTVIIAWQPVADTDGGRLHEPAHRALRAGRDATVGGDQSGVMADTDRVRRSGQQRARGAARPAVGACARRACGQDALPASTICRVADGLPAWLGDGPVPRAIGGPDLGPDGRAALRAIGNAVAPRVGRAAGLWLLRIARREGIL